MVNPFKIEKNLRNSAWMWWNDENEIREIGQFGEDRTGYDQSKDWGTDLQDARPARRDVPWTIGMGGKHLIIIWRILLHILINKLYDKTHKFNGGVCCTVVVDEKVVFIHMHLWDAWN